MLQKVPLDKLKDNPFQPRFNVNIDDPDIKELADSIRENGLNQPIKVTVDHSDGSYFIVFGHRRAMASRLLGLKEIDAIVVDIDGEGKEARMSAIIENIQRENLNPIEIAKAYDDALKSGIAFNELCQKLGKKKSAVSKIHKCLSLDTRILDFYREHRDAKKDATILYELANCVKNGDKQWEIFNTYQDGSSNREALLRLIKSMKPSKAIKKQVDEDTKLMYDHQGFKVRAKFLIGLPEAKKTRFENDLKELLDKYRV